MSIRDNTNDHKYGAFFIIVPILIGAFMWFKHNYPLLSLALVILTIVWIFAPSKRKQHDQR